MAFDPSKSFTVVEEPEEPSGGFDPGKPFTVVEESASFRPAIPEPGESLPSETSRQLTPVPQAFPVQGQAMEAGAQEAPLTAVEAEEMLSTPQATIPRAAVEGASRAIEAGVPGMNIPGLKEYTGPVIRGGLNVAKGLAEFATAPGAPLVAAAQLVPGIAIPLNATMAAGMVKSGAQIAGEAYETGDREKMAEGVFTAGLGALGLGGTLAQARPKRATAEPPPIPKQPTLLKQTEAEVKALTGERTPSAISQRETTPLPVEEPPRSGALVVEEVRQQARPDDAAAKTEAPEIQRDVAVEPVAPATEPVTAPEATSPIGMGGAVPSEFVPESRTATGIKNAAVDAERQSRGLEPVMRPERLANQVVWERTMAKIDADPGWQDRLIKEMKDNPRTPSADEVVALDHRYVDLQNEYAKATRDAAQAFDDGRTADVAAAQGRLADWESKLTELELVAHNVGTEWGRSGQMRQRLMLEDFSLEAMEMRKRAGKNFEPLTDTERATIQKQHAELQTQIAELDKRVATRDQQLSQSEAARVMAELKAQAAAEPKYEPRVLKVAEDFASFMDKKAASAMERLKERMRGVSSLDPAILADMAIVGAAKITRGLTDFAKWSDQMARELGEWSKPYLKEAWDASQKAFQTDLNTFAKPLGRMAKDVKKAVNTGATENTRETIVGKIKAKVDAGQLSEITALAQKLARQFVTEGVRDIKALVAAVHNELKAIIPEFTERQAMDAISGYGQFKQLARDDISVILRDLKGQGQQIAKLEDMASGKAPLKTGIERRTPSDAERALIKEVNEAKKKGGYTVTDPAAQLASALEARKTYYRNRLKDLQREIDAREKTVKTERKPPTDVELEALKKEYEKVRDDHAKEFPRDAEIAAVEALESSISEYAKRVKENDLFLAKPTVLDTPRLRVLRQQREALVKRLNSMRESSPETFEKEKSKIQKSIDALVDQINKGDIAAKKRSPKTVPPEIEALRAERNDLLNIKRQLQNALKPKRDPLEIALTTVKTRLENQIKDLSTQLASRQKTVKQQRSIQYDAEADALRARRDELKGQFDAMFPKEPLTDAQRLERWKTRTEKRTAELEQRIKDKDFSTKKREPIVLDAEALKMERRIEDVKREFNEGVLNDKLARRTGAQKVFGRGMEALNLSRAILTSVDLSSVLRQGGFIGFGHPARAASSIPAMLRAFASKEAQFKVESEIRARPTYDMARKAKLELTEHGATSLAKMEEAFMSRLAEKIPIVAGSQRAYTTFLNKLRMDSFDAMVKSLSRDGKNVTEAESKVIANFINVATGRGKLGANNQAAVGLNTAFFAPKFVASRFQLLALEPLYYGGPTGKVRGAGRARSLVAAEYGRFLTGAALVYTLGKLAGGDIESDPRSSDFGKIKFGDTRIDPLGGLLQATVFLSREISGATKTIRGKTVPIRGKVPYGGQTGADVAGKFLRTKLSPALGTAFDIASGENVVGEPTTPATVAQRMLVPISLQDIKATMEEQGVPAGTAMSVLSLLGAGVQTYD